MSFQVFLAFFDVSERFFRPSFFKKRDRPSFLGRRPAILRTTPPQMLVGAWYADFRSRTDRQFWSGCLTPHQAARTSCHLETHGDKLAAQYFSAVLRVKNVSAFSIQLCWRAAACAGPFCGEINGRKAFLRYGQIGWWGFPSNVSNTRNNQER